MKIRERLITSFFILIMIPIILVFFSCRAILNYQISSIQQSYNVESDSIKTLINPIQILNRITRGVYNDIKANSLKSPENLENIGYIRKLNEELKGKYSYVVLRKNNRILYCGNDKKFEKIKNNLPNFGSYNANIDGAIFISGKNPFMVKQQDFYFTDNSEGSIFIIMDVNTLLPQIKSFTIQISISFIIIICFTAAILTFWIYKSILKPLNALRVAAIQIKDGNLSYSVKPEYDDEIGALCEDFEEMRIKLKDLIEVRMQYEKDIKELISNISHDLKTPLTAIKGYSEGIMDGVADTPEKMNRYLKTIYTKANDMTSLVDELSLYSMIDCDSMLYNFQNVNLDNYFKDCISELALDLEVKNIELVYFNYTEAMPKVIADVEQLKRVVNNIIGNSVKYKDKKKGIINVKTIEAGEFVQVEIEDNGKGIAQKDMGNIFDRFYRTDASRNSSKGGSGLGLAIAKKIIEDHGGRIWAASEENVGTCIYFTLKKSEEGMLADASLESDNKLMAEKVVMVSDSKKKAAKRKQKDDGGLKT